MHARASAPARGRLRVLRRGASVSATRVVRRRARGRGRAGVGSAELVYVDPAGRGWTRRTGRTRRAGRTHRALWTRRAGTARQARRSLRTGRTGRTCRPRTACSAGRTCSTRGPRNACRTLRTCRTRRPFRTCRTCRTRRARSTCSARRTGLRDDLRRRRLGRGDPVLLQLILRGDEIRRQIRHDLRLVRLRLPQRMQVDDGVHDQAQSYQQRTEQDVPQAAPNRAGQDGHFNALPLSSCTPPTRQRSVSRRSRVPRGRGSTRSVRGPRSV